MDPNSPVARAVDGDAMIDACRAAVRIPSETGSEEAVAGFLRARMLRLGFDDVEIDRNGNVVGCVRGTGGGPSVMINGHLDHVPPGEMVDPYCGEIVDAARWGEKGFAIRGRGSCDMKCNLVAATFAVGALRAAGLRPRGDIIVVGDVEEEIDSPRGVISVIERGLRADFGLSVESTNGRIHFGHRGKLEFALTVTGRTSHASEPENAVNAITAALPFIAALEEAARNLPGHKEMGQATMTATGLHSFPDNGSALVPDRAVLRIDRRYLPGEGPETVEAELRRLFSGIEPVRGAGWGLELINHYPLMDGPRDGPMAQALHAAAEAVTGRAPERGYWRFGVNGTFMQAAGVPTIGFGPGNERWAHTPEEHILVEDLLTFARILAVALADLTEAGPA
jgi:putative selenium metabolism hydrolase